MPARRYRQFLMALTITLSPLVLPASSQATVKSVVKIRWVGERPSPARSARKERMSTPRRLPQGDSCPKGSGRQLTNSTPRDVLRALVSRTRCCFLPPPALR